MKNLADNLECVPSTSSSSIKLTELMYATCDQLTNVKNLMTQLEESLDKFESYPRPNNTILKERPLDTVMATQNSIYLDLVDVRERLSNVMGFIHCVLL